MSAMEIPQEIKGKIEKIKGISSKIGESLNKKNINPENGKLETYSKTILSISTLEEFFSLDLTKFKDYPRKFVALLFKKFPDIDASKYKATGWLKFSSFEFLTTAPKIYNLTSRKGAIGLFFGCRNLTTVPEFDTSQVIYFDEMFDGCENLKSLPAFDTSNGTSFGKMFQNCKSLTDASWLDTSKASGDRYSYSLSQLFAGCRSLTKIPIIHMENVANIRLMFSNCWSLTEIPEPFDTSNIADFGCLFSNCKSLTKVPKLNTSKGTDFDCMFSGCESLLEVPPIDLSSLGKYSSGVEEMFSDCYNLTTIPWMDTSNCANFDGTFKGCKKLRRLPNLDVSKAEDLSYTFFGCVNLTDLDTTPYIDKNNVEHIPWAINTEVDFGLCPLNHKSIVHILNHLGHGSGPLRIWISPYTNSLLNDTERAIATAKGWTLNVESSGPTTSPDDPAV